jgi:hypothetical protein
MCRLAVAADRKSGGIVANIGPIELLFIVIIALVLLGILVAVLRSVRRR